MNSRQQLVDSLAADLRPGRPLPPVNRVLAVWLPLSLLYVMLASALLGPIRETALVQLQTEPHFLLETLLGLAAIAATAFAAFRAGVPGLAGRGPRLVAGVLVAAWLLNHLVGLAYPALEPGMLGKRPHCYLETLLLAVPPLLAALYWLGRAYPLSPTRVMLAAGLACGLMPALYMQIACMYEPAHILKFHILPGLLVAPLALLVNRLLPRGRRVCA